MDNTQLFRDLPHFYHKWAPATWSLGFLEAPLSIVRKVVIPWKQSNGDLIDVNEVKGVGDDMFTQLLPLTASWRRELWMETQSSWLAYVDNASSYSRPDGPVHYLSRILKCRGALIRCIPHTLEAEVKGAKGTYGGIQFHLLGPESTSGYLRSIDMICDSGLRWRFEEHGTLQPFENTAVYTARRAIERFTPQMLVDYCQALGIRLYDQAFYGPRGELLEILSNRVKQTYTLAEAQMEMRVPRFQASPKDALRNDSSHKKEP